MPEGLSTPGTSSPVSPWEVARKIIEHEDNLINHRLTWLFTIQGFLFASFAVVAKDLLDSTHGKAALLRVMMFATTFLGIASAFIVWNSIRTAFLYTHHITDWWNHNFASSLRIEGRLYPPLRGSRGKMSALRRWLHPPIIPWALIAVWLVLLAAGIIW